MLNIFDYTNYREFIRDFYLQKKKQNSSFSYQLFANKAGFKSKSFIKLVIDGKKNLTKDSAHRLNEVLTLSEKSFSYFIDLIEFNQAKTYEMQSFYLDKILKYNKRNPTRIILQQQYDFYSQWYHNTIRELITQVEFDEDYDLLASMLTPKITAKQAKDSVKLLHKLDLVEKQGKKYKQTDNILSTGDEVRSFAVKKFHIQNLELASKSIANHPSSGRDISCLVMGLSENAFDQVKHEIQRFRKKLLSIAETDKNQEGVYHINFQLFPTSGKKGIN